MSRRVSPDGPILTKGKHSLHQNLANVNTYERKKLWKMKNALAVNIR